MLDLWHQYNYKKIYQKYISTFSSLINLTLLSAFGSYGV